MLRCDRNETVLDAAVGNPGPELRGNIVQRDIRTGAQLQSVGRDAHAPYLTPFSGPFASSGRPTGTASTPDAGDKPEDMPFGLICFKLRVNSPGAEARTRRYKPGDKSEVTVFRGDELMTLQLKWVTQAQFAGYYVAKDKGFYEEEGLDIEIKPGGPDIAPPQVIAI